MAFPLKENVFPIAIPLHVSFDYAPHNSAPFFWGHTNIKAVIITESVK